MKRCRDGGKWPENREMQEALSTEQPTEKLCLIPSVVIASHVIRLLNRRFFSFYFSFKFCDYSHAEQ